MIVNNIIKSRSIKQNDLCIEILESGTIADIHKGNVQINLLSGNDLEGSTSNIYLRIFENGKPYFTKLLGVGSPSSYYLENNRVVYKGNFYGIDYLVILTLVDNVWFYEVILNCDEEKTVDLVYGQDVGINNRSSIRNNEAYTCHYLDHKVFKTEIGYTICTRQNQGIPHFLQQGTLTKNISYSTDGFQFFGLDYKITNIPVALLKNTLENRNYQYEFAYIALQTERVTFSGQKKFVFYALYEDNLPDIVEEPQFIDKINSLYEEISRDIQIDDVKLCKLDYSLSFNELYNSPELNTDELNSLYPKQEHQEVINNQVVSFFLEDSTHVVLKSKETLVERPHGNIIISGNNLSPDNHIITTTNYIFGVFNSHIAVGNPNFNKFLTNLRNPLNTLKISGQRIFLKIDGNYYLLGVPSVYEVGLNYSKWIYKLPDDYLIITSMTHDDSPQIILDVTSRSGKSYDFLITNNVVLGPSENQYPFNFEIEGNTLEFIPNKDSIVSQKYPDLRYNMVILADNFNVNQDNVFFSDNVIRNNQLVVIDISSSNSFRVIIQGRLDGEKYPVENHDLWEIKQAYLKLYKGYLNNFYLEINNEWQTEVDKFNHLALWYTHNALIHYASPHGLEQYSGAAWGTRDVCQGPFEYFLVTQKYSILKEIIKKVFSRQFMQTGNFPQWFMYDRYQLQAKESHGDVIIWPLRTVALYLLTTGDYSILEEKVPYTDYGTLSYTEDSYTIYEHTKKLIGTIKANFIPGTHLSKYGGGDWNDTLQPANKELTKRMVSGWTVALTYEVINQYVEALIDYDIEYSNELRSLADNIYHDYQKYIIIDGIPAGLVIFEEDGVVPLLHPKDNISGVKYRLLPFNQGIIGELFTKEKVHEYYDITQKYLQFPDGMRLMDNTIQYRGGKNTYFTRAETAANFGREIGLLYIHAHIRYIEAMAKLGKRDTIWNNLLKVNPININEVVPNALPRQSNTYFSSSDANFSDRYEAMKHYDDLRSGKFGVKGGWRIYSSGPGIYLNQLISNCLGIRIFNNNLIIDPVLPIKLNGLTFTYSINDKNVKIKYHLTGSNEISEVLINGHDIPINIMNNKYRSAGVMIDKDILNTMLSEEVNLIEVFM